MALPHIGQSILSGIYLGSFFYDYGKSSSQEEMTAVWLRFCLLPLCFGLLQTVLFLPLLLFTTAVCCSVAGHLKFQPAEETANPGTSLIQIKPPASQGHSGC